MPDQSTYLRRQPQQDRSRERLETLLTATSEVLADEGAEGLTISAIAERAQLPASSIYEYVGDAVDLVALTTISSLDRLEAAVSELAAKVADASGARTFLRKTYAAALEHFEAEPGLPTALGLLDSNPQTAGIHASHSRRVAELVTTTIRPHVPSTRRRGLADRVFLLIHLGHAAANLQQTDADSAKAVEREFRRLLDGLLDD